MKATDKIELVSMVCLAVEITFVEGYLIIVGQNNAWNYMLYEGKNCISINLLTIISRKFC